MGMTGEEAIKRLKEARKTIQPFLYVDKAIDYAIKALEQQPCEDCISRKAVDTLVDELARAISDERCCMSRGRATSTIMQDILDLPSVTPQPKVGKWIDVDSLDGALWHECSECGETEFYATDYCPNCGAKMEVEE